LRRERAVRKKKSREGESGVEPQHVVRGVMM